MGDLNLNNLISNRSEILKAEIGALLFNLGKTHIGFWRKKRNKDGKEIIYFQVNDTIFAQQFGYKPFSSYKSYYQKDNDLGKSPFEYELEKINSNLMNFVFETIKFPFDIENGKNEIVWNRFFRSDFLEDGEEGKDFIQKIFFRGCENINSGIDKGSPNKQLQSLWISNAFGSFKQSIEEKYFDERRLCFFKRFYRYLENNNFYTNPDWGKIRNWILVEVKSWYSRLLSDSRFPVNDVSLWDQAYMTASMFKAILAGLFIDDSKDKNGKTRFQRYLEKPQSIKWSIFGIQYNKLGLSEKGLKVASIKWYRDTTDKVDNEIKKLLESYYALGNEVYRDETGIYFVVAENMIGEKKGDFYNLNNNLSKIKDDIQGIFTKNFEGEIYPAIFLTEPSRGLMNLGYFIENAKENFLKAEYPQNFKDKLKHDTNPNGICQICKMRLAHKKAKDNLFCDVCESRLKRRIDNWFKNPESETIWLDELQDKNGRIALITLKFELGKWLNGDLLNSLIVQQGQFELQLNNNIKNFIYLFLTELPLDFGLNIKEIVGNLKNTNDRNEIQKLRCKKGSLELLKRKIESIKNLIEQIRKSNWFEKPLKEYLGISSFTGKDFDGVYSEILKIYEQIKVNYKIKVFEYISLFPKELSSDAYNGCKKNNETFDDYIRQVFFGPIRGNIWEDFIKSSILSSAIDWQAEKINWKRLTAEQINFLSQILHQFLLRKNPSPARLRRIWETTKEFFENLESKIIGLAGIRRERAKRLTWKNVDIPDGEYEDEELLFWAKDKTVYLISSIEKVGAKNEFKLKIPKEQKVITTLNRNNVVEQTYNPYFTILKPTPMSWQFIIPAENVPELIKNVQKEYYKNFRWVYGKLSLHTGIVVQNYKKPLYIGIKALRKIRREVVKWEYLGKPIPAVELNARQKYGVHCHKNLEITEGCENFYSLYEKVENKGKYEFYLYPEKEKIWVDTTQNATETDKFIIYPNTFDFEFLDSNIRRNDIYYRKGKRVHNWKQLRPYDLSDWQYFEKFRKYFFSNKKLLSKLQKLIFLIYSKLEDWRNENEGLRIFMLSAFVNLMELKDEMQKYEFAGIMGAEKFNDLKDMNILDFKKKLLMLIDMFEFWHTMLKYDGLYEKIKKEVIYE